VSADEQDEIDAIGSARSEGDSPHNGVLTSLLNEMDGIEELSNVIVVGATNRPDVLVRSTLLGLQSLHQDSALMRPGRLDRILYVDAPDQAARHEIFRIRLGNMAVEPDVSIEPLASAVSSLYGSEAQTDITDRRMFRSRDHLDMSRRSTHDHERRS
jgi:AAA family ATPase